MGAERDDGRLEVVQADAAIVRNPILDHVTQLVCKPLAIVVAVVRSTDSALFLQHFAQFKPQGILVPGNKEKNKDVFNKMRKSIPRSI